MLFPLLLFFTNLAVAQQPEKEPDRATLQAKLQRGLTRDEVVKLLGPPALKARLILYNRHLEQWRYYRPLEVRLEFDCPRGREATLNSFSGWSIRCKLSRLTLMITPCRGS